jgi:hypothetical protein
LTLSTAAAYAQTAPPASTGPAAAAADTNPLGWTAKAGLSFVQTGGNSETSTLGFKFNATHNWEKTYFTLVGGGVRSDTTSKNTFGVGLPGDFLVVEREEKETTAENYFLDGSVDHNVTDRLYWGVGTGWLRNTFSGVESRINARAGGGYIWTDPKGKGAQFKTGLFLTLTNQSLVIDDPTVDDTFIGLRGLIDLVVPFGASSFNSRVNLDENLQQTDDFRMTWWNSLGVNLTDRFALQLSLLLYFDNLPALQEIPIYAAQASAFPVGPQVGLGLTPYGKWDREFAVSLVINLAPKKPAKKA